MVGKMRYTADNRPHSPTLGVVRSGKQPTMKRRHLWFFTKGETVERNRASVICPDKELVHHHRLYWHHAGNGARELLHPIAQRNCYATCRLFCVLLQSHDHRRHLLSTERHLYAVGRHYRRCVGLRSWLRNCLWHRRRWRASTPPQIRQVHSHLACRFRPRRPLVRAVGSSGRFLLAPSASRPHLHLAASRHLTDELLEVPVLHVARFGALDLRPRLDRHAARR